MRVGPLKLRLAFALMGALAAFGACGDDVQMRSGRGGDGGKSGASGAAAAASGAGMGGASSGAAGMPTPQQIHDGLLNAATNGGIEVARAPATTYPSCQ